MNWLHYTILAAVAVSIPLFLWSRKLAWGYLRVSALLGISAIMLLPFVWLVCAAFKDKQVLNEYTFLPPISTWRGDHVLARDAQGATQLVPLESLAESERADIEPDKVIRGSLNVDNFRTLFEPKETTQGPVGFGRYLINSLFLASASTVVSLFFCSLGGYALAKYQFRGKTLLMTFMLGSIMIPGIVFLIPNWVTIWRIGWMDSYSGLIVPGAVSAFGLFLFRQAMLGVPTELIEAGRIDGCSEFRIYYSLVMPLVRPMIGAHCLLSFLGNWNAYQGPNMYLQTQYKATLPIVLNQYIGVYSQQYGVFLAGTLLAIIPPAILFFALQREFISGLQSGALKQ